MIHATLKNCTLLNGVNLDFIDQLTKIHSVKHYKKGDFIIHQGSTGDGAYIVLEGEVEIVLEPHENSKDDELILVEKGGAGEFFGEISFLKSLKRTASVRALSDVKLLFLEAKKFNEEVQKDNAEALKIIHNIATSLVERLENANHLLAKMHAESEPETVTKEIATYRKKLLSEVLI